MKTVQTNNFSIVFCSDWQYPWTAITDARNGSAADKAAFKKQNDEGTEQRESEKAILFQKVSMLLLHTMLMQQKPLKAVVCNGDITSFGHDWQLKKIKEIWGKDFPVPIYIGLGNHDYANNVNDSFENSCAFRMIEYLRDEVKKRGITDFDFSEKAGYNGLATVTYSGSLAYSWDIDNVHFVQLNNYPIYETSFSGFDAAQARKKYAEIKHSLNWLEKDLSKAAGSGKAIILNYHDSDEHWSDNQNINTNALTTRFKDLLTKYGVSAIFVGHYHASLGKGNPGRVSYGSTPVFYCGSASQQKYLLVGFQRDKFVVEKINSSTSAPQRTMDGTYNLITGRRGPLASQPLPPPSVKIKLKSASNGQYLCASDGLQHDKWLYCKPGTPLTFVVEGDLNNCSLRVDGTNLYFSYTDSTGAVKLWNTKDKAQFKLERQSNGNYAIKNLHYNQYVWLSKESPYITRAGSASAATGQWRIEGLP